MEVELHQHITLWDNSTGLTQLQSRSSNYTCASYLGVANTMEPMLALAITVIMCMSMHPIY